METPDSTVALITGAGSGIGAATAARLADTPGIGGLVLTDRDGDALDEVAARLDRPGLQLLTHTAAKECAPDRIRVNAILPAGVQTPIWRSVPFFQQLVQDAGGEQAAFDRMAAMATPLGRYATSDEVASQIAFLLSDAAATITGAALLSDGGYTL